MNNKGQLIISDLLLYLVAITIILGFIIYFSATLTNSQVSTINDNELNKQLDDLTSLLISTSGNPENWEKLGTTSDIRSIGLKSTDNNLISYDKLLKLKQNSFLLDDYLPSGVSYSITISPENNEQTSTLIAGEPTLSDKKNVQTRQIPIIIDYAYEIINDKTDNTNNICPYNHDNKTWQCRIININSTKLDQGNYYIITRTTTPTILSNTYNDNITKTCNNILNINNQLKNLQKNENQTIYIHFKNKDNNTYIVYDTNNREEYLNTIIQPKIYKLNIQIAT